MTRTTVKTIANAIVGSSAMTVIGNAITMLTPIGLTPIGRVVTAIGSIAISMYVGDTIGEYAESKVDEVADTINDVKNAATVSEEVEA